MAGHLFLSYSSTDALDFALRLREELEVGPPHLAVWLDRQLKPGQEWDSAIGEAIRSCDCFLFVISKDSVEDHSPSKLELSRASSYKKPIVPLLARPGVELPLLLTRSKFIDFTGSFELGMAWLRKHLTRLEPPVVALRDLEGLLSHARDELALAHGADVVFHYKTVVAQLELQIEAQRRIVHDPDGTWLVTSLAKPLKLPTQRSEPTDRPLREIGDLVAGMTGQLRRKTLDEALAWKREFNDHRLRLIERQNRQGISDSEAAELAELQRKAEKYAALVFTIRQMPDDSTEQTIDAI